MTDLVIFFVTKHYHRLCLLLILILVLACNKPFEIEPINLNQLIVVDTLYVNKSETFDYSIMPRWQTKVLNDTSYLIISSKSDEGLQLLILDDKSLVYKGPITIPQFGPNGFKTNSPSFYWHNSDSIFVFPTSLNKVFLYNRSSDLMKTYQFNYNLYLSFDSNEQQQGGSLVGNILYINTVPYANPNNLEFTSNTFVSHSLNLLTNELKVTSGYHEKFKNRILPTAFLGGQIIKAFDSLLLINNFHSDSIDYFKINSPKIRGLSAGLTDYPHLIGQSKSIDNRGSNSFVSQLRNVNYYKMIYDPYSKKILRFSTHINKKYENYSDSEIIREVENNNSQLLLNTIITIDSSMRKSYYRLPFNVEYVFPTNDGLIIQSSSLELENRDVFMKIRLNY
jgi:hypothetical protein